MKLLIALFVPLILEAQTLISVTNLNDSGPGSLRACVEASGPRVCNFEVAGYLDLKTRLTATFPDLTIAGETAPDPGIHIRGATLTISASHVRIRHIAVRPGDGPGTSPGSRDGVVILADKGLVEDVTLEHVSLTHAIDENFSTYGPTKDITVEDSIISEPLWRSIHPENEMKHGKYQGHAMGALIDAKTNNLRWRRNLMVSNVDRNLRMKAEVRASIYNNYVTNWGGISGWNLQNQAGGTSAPAVLLNFVENVYVRGSQVEAGIPDFPCIYEVSVPATSKIYAKGNVCPAGVVSYLADSYFIPAPIAPWNEDEVMPSSAVLGYVAKNAGARPWARHPFDARIVKEALDLKPQVKDCITKCDTNPDGTVDVQVPEGGWPDLNVTPGPTLTPTPVTPTATPTITPTVAMCWMPCATPTGVPTVTRTASPTVTPRPTATVTRTPTPWPTSSVPCDDRLNRCSNLCEECSRYLANKIGAHPYDPMKPCEYHVGTCWLLCEDCRRLIK